MPAKRRTLGRVLTGLAWFAAGLVVVFGGVVVSCAVVVSQLDIHFGRKHLKAIAIDTRACPYVESMHQAAQKFEDAHPYAKLFGPSNSTPWPKVKARLEHTIDALDRTIRRAGPHFPWRVQLQLAVAHGALRQGRAKLPSARSWGDANARTYKIESRGQDAFGNASDLIGHACRVPLGV